MPEAVNTIDVEAIAVSAPARTIDLSNTAPMTLEEAEAGWARVNLAAEFTQFQLLELYRRQAWKAYVDEDGNPLYGGWQECAMDKLDKGRTAIHYMLKSAELQARLIDQGIDQFTVVNLTESSTYTRYITQAPEPQQGEVARTLLNWGKDGEITEQDAEAALLKVNREKRYQKAEKLVADFFAGNPESPESNAFFEWAQEKKRVTPRLREVLADDVEVFLARPPQKATSSERTSTTSTAPTRAARPDKSMEIASELNKYEPEEVAKALNDHLDEEYLAAVTPTKSIQIARPEGLRDDEIAEAINFLSDFDPTELVYIITQLPQNYVAAITLQFR